MPKIRGYLCECGNSFEHNYMTQAEEAASVACPACGALMTERDEVMGGQPMGTIVPMHNRSLRQKAGYVHTHGDRPAERGSVAVPSNKGSF